MQLSEKDYLSKGKFRSVYIHPENPEICIKIGNEKFHTRALKRELKYVPKYQKRLNFLSGFHGAVETNLGKGYMFDIIRDYDGSISQTLESSLPSLNQEEVIQKLESMYSTLLAHRAPVGDFHARNILVRKTTPKEYELWIIDGFGNSDFIKICDFSKHLLQKKLIRKFNKLCKRLNLPKTF